MLGDAILTSKGIVSQDHVMPLKELEAINIPTKRPIKLIDSLRKLKRDINYYGYIPSKAEAEDAVSIAHACFNPLLDYIRKELNK
jgi:hypothetical protein